jgi:hypothetical protein
MTSFFVDFQILPLLVQDNYLNGASGSLHHISRAADAISDGDLLGIEREEGTVTTSPLWIYFMAIEKINFSGTMMQKTQDYSILPAMGLLSTVAPGHYVPTGGKGSGSWGYGFPRYVVFIIILTSLVGLARTARKKRTTRS